VKSEKYQQPDRQATTTVPKYSFCVSGSDNPVNRKQPPRAVCYTPAGWNVKGGFAIQKVL